MAASFEQRVTAHAVVGVDTAVFIYHLEANAPYLPLTHVVLKQIESGQCRGVTSSVTLMELTVHPWRANREDVARQYELLLVHFPNLEMVDVTRAVARRAAQLRARYGVRPADALQVAAALVHGATAWISNDQKLNRLAPEIDVILLSDYVG